MEMEKDTKTIGKPVSIPVTDQNKALMKDSLNKIRTHQEPTTD